MLKHFIKYYLRADTKYRIHSPFVFKLLKDVIEDDRYYYAFDVLNTLRARLLQKNELIEVLDLGAGSRKGQGNKRKISEIAKTSVSPNWQCQFLFRLANQLQPQRVLELGSSLGLSSLALRFGSPASAKLMTLEGSPEIARLAAENFSLLGASNLELIEGPFEKTLPEALKKLEKIDMAFIDGHHLKEPTLLYFEQILPFLNKNAVLVFDDIYWSDEMAEAWLTLKQHPSVILSIDLFWCGLLFFSPDFKEKQHFTLIPSNYKPWQLGFWR